MDISQAYNLVNAEINPTVLAVDNPFIRQLAYLSTQQAQNLKLTSFILKNSANNRGEIAQRGIHAQDKSVIDITKLTPLVDGQNFRTLQEEIAFTRNWQLQFHDTKDHPTWWRDHAEMLMVDYLLASSLCFIEIFDKAAVGVEKFFATRNRFLAGALSNQTPQETQKYTNYLQSFSQNFETKQLKVLKITVSKNAFKITQPRSFVDFNRPIKITPVFLMTSFMDGLSPLLAQGVLKFRYLKDNLTEREFISTTNPQLLIQTYGEDFAQKMIAQIGSHFNRGYVKLPEFGISRYDYTGVRALNVSRITEIQRIQPNEVDLSFVDVDFETILPNIKQGIYDIHNTQVLQMVYQELSGKQLDQPMTIHELRQQLDEFIDAQHAIGTTTALRYMHKYMVARANLFPKYNGGKPIQYGYTAQPSQPQQQTAQPTFGNVEPQKHVFGEPVPNVQGNTQSQQPTIPTPPQDFNPLEAFGVSDNKQQAQSSINALPNIPDPNQPKSDTPPNLFGTSFNLGGVED